MSENVKSLEGELVSFKPDTPNLSFDISLQGEMVRKEFDSTSLIDSAGAVKIRYFFDNTDDLVNAGNCLNVGDRVKVNYSEGHSFYLLGCGKIEVLILNK